MARLQHLRQGREGKPGRGMAGVRGCRGSRGPQPSVVNGETVLMGQATQGAFVSLLPLPG